MPANIWRLRRSVRTKRDGRRAPVALNDLDRSRNQSNRPNCDPRHGGVGRHSAVCGHRGRKDSRRQRKTRWSMIMSNTQEIRTLTDNELDLATGGYINDAGCILQKTINLTEPKEPGQFQDQ